MLNDGMMGKCHAEHASMAMKQDYDRVWVSEEARSTRIIQLRVAAAMSSTPLPSLRSFLASR
jgi:hypothetical protein